jgi:hypothetical protein
VQWADADDDGDVDLALAGTAPGATHPLLRNLLERSAAARGVTIRVLDARGRMLPGAEVRVYRAGTASLLGTGLIDAGSGYNSQSVLPVHVGVADAAAIDIEVIVPARGARNVTRLENVAVSTAGPAVATVRVPLP